MRALFQFINKFSLIQQICVGLLIGIGIAVWSPENAVKLSLLGTIFVGALKGVAPVLVFFLVIAAVSRHRSGQKTGMRSIIALYIIGTFASAAIAVIGSFLFPTPLLLTASPADTAPPSGITAVLSTLLTNVVENPVKAILGGNYIGILGWALLFGFALRHAANETKDVMASISDAITLAVQWIIKFAPLGIMGLVAQSIGENGLGALLIYGKLLLVLLGCMFTVALIINPIIVAFVMKRNPYPLVFRCLRESGVTAFFTRSSAANIPVNMDLAKRLSITPDTYSISIPLGATINMGGAAITITVMALAAVSTLGIHVDFATAILLSVLATISACGASGVAGGSLLLIPLACSLFGISNDVAMQVVGVGFIIGVIQDSTETALNSSTDILFTAAVDYSRHGYPVDKV